MICSNSKLFVAGGSTPDGFAVDRLQVCSLDNFAQEIGKDVALKHARISPKLGVSSKHLIIAGGLSHGM